ncbi:N-6 DNA methylase [Halorubrum sp. 48-1-W]|uniref:N-6 DNA methylase n=1 Tax=Halorubrum sp. 48-1-W TaxID=2249761 RepID=UPI000FCA78C1|nr:N-6 DNA methylase [Halorubrum sp. 48-1-W]
MIDQLQTDGELARKAFNNFNNKFGSETTLKNTIDDIESLDFWDQYEGYSDFFGDAYEFLLEKYADKADGAGEYFTPRPLIHAMVNVVDPGYTESIYDPASGTNGFLIEAYNHVGDKTAGEIRGQSRQFLETPDDGPRSYAEQLTGRELTSQTYRLGLMNLILHDIDPTEMESLRGNSLTRSVDQEYDVVLANPPYGGNGSDKFTGAWADSPAPETNFLQLIMRSLSKNGRAAVIVPEGILFRGGAEQSVRERLLEQYNLDCVLVLPESSFHPYAEVDANVLFFERDSEGTDEVWYYDMRSDTEKIKESNPLTKNHFEEFVQNFEGEENRRDTEHFFTVPESDIKSNDYDLNHTQYKEYAASQFRHPVEVAEQIEDTLSTFQSVTQPLVTGIPFSGKGETTANIPKETNLPNGWSLEEVSNICEVNRTNYNLERDYPDHQFKYVSVSDVDEESGEIYNHETITGSTSPSRAKRVMAEEDTIVSTVRPYLKGFAKVPDEYDGHICSTAFAVLTPTAAIDSDYLFYAVRSPMFVEQLRREQRGAAYPAVGIQDVKDAKIPVPDIDVQKQVVSQYTTYEDGIHGARKRVRELQELFDEYENSILSYLLQGDLSVTDSQSDLKND